MTSSQVFLTFNLTLSSVFLVYLLFYILRNDNKSKQKRFSINNILPGKRKTAQETKCDLNQNFSSKVLDIENGFVSQSFENISYNRELKTKAERKTSLSLNSSGGIDLGFIGGRSDDTDVDSNPDKTIYYSR